MSFQLIFPSCSLLSGNPKGAMLTHGNVVADFSGFLKVTEVNKVDFLMQVYSQGHPQALRGLFCAFFFFPLI